MTKEECEIETSKAIMEMRNRITDLEKENAELKDKLNNLASVAEVRLANCQKYANELEEAKNHIHRLLVLLTEGKRSYAVIDEARAFLKEDTNGSKE